MGELPDAGNRFGGNDKVNVLQITIMPKFCFCKIIFFIKVDKSKKY
jgi:hypothetical protein